MTKLVNGVEVPLTQADRDQRAIDEAAHKIRVLDLYKNDRRDAILERESVGDQLDTILKQFASLRDSGSSTTQEMGDLLDFVQEVKTAHPKPVELDKRKAK